MTCHRTQTWFDDDAVWRELAPFSSCVFCCRPVPEVIDFGVAKATQARLTEKTVERLRRAPVLQKPHQRHDWRPRHGYLDAEIDLLRAKTP
jgi:hypothetical protein